MLEEFYKLRCLPPYGFEQVNRLEMAARAKGADIMDAGMGSPALSTLQSMVDKWCEAARAKETHRFFSSFGVRDNNRACRALVENKHRLRQAVRTIKRFFVVDDIVRAAG